MSTDPVLSAATRVIPSFEYRRERWRNGLGWTREILRVPDTDDWQVRLSIAEIEQDAAFSSFPGIERELVLLRGEGLRLRFADGAVQTLLPPHDRLRFAGEAEIHGELVDGLTHDFNLMWRRDALEAELLHRPLVGSMFFFTEPTTAWAIHLWPGRRSSRATPTCRQWTPATPPGWRPARARDLRCVAAVNCSRFD